jgi:N-acetyl-anhydromuramyl-L-alanine amidase AmpD
MARKVINTPNLLASQYGLETPLTSVEGTSLKVKYKSVTEKVVKREKLVEKQVNEEVQLGGLATPNPPTPSPDPTPSPTGYNGTYDTNYILETRPSKFPIKTKHYNSQSRKGGIPNGKQRDLNSVKFIVLHHTATESLKDKGKSTFNSWKNRGASSHAVMDGNGHIEYMIPIRYVANTQGVIYNDPKNKYSTSNKCGISIEIQNVGYLNKSEKRDNFVFWGRSNIKKSKWIKEEFTSVHYDYNLKPIRKYKGQPRSEEYTDSQVNALAGWIKEMLKATGITWKFTEETYKEMFPNSTINKNKIPKLGSVTVKNVVYVKYKQDRSLPFSTTFWGISKNFYNKVKGVYTHNSIVPEKIDLCPTYNIINMLKNNFS